MNQAFGWPNRTVRALALFAIIAIDGYMWIMQIAIDDFQKSISLLILTFYFADPRKESVDEEKPPPKDLLAEARQHLGE